MYKNLRDGFSILLGLGFLSLSALFMSGVLEYDREKYSAAPPLLLGCALVACGVIPMRRRRRAAQEAG